MTQKLGWTSVTELLGTRELLDTVMCRRDEVAKKSPFDCRVRSFDQRYSTRMSRMFVIAVVAAFQGAARIYELSSHAEFVLSLNEP